MSATRQTMLALLIAAALVSVSLLTHSTSSSTHTLSTSSVAAETCEHEGHVSSARASEHAIYVHCSSGVIVTLAR